MAIAFDLGFQIVVMVPEKFSGNINQAVENHDNVLEEIHDTFDDKRSFENGKELEHDGNGRGSEW